MKTKNKILILLTILALTICVGCSKEEPVENSKKETKVATIHYSYMLGMDAGAEYTIDIYETKKNEYKYEILKSEITIAGANQEEKVKTDVIKSSQELKDLDKKYQDKKEMGAPITKSYYYSVKTEKELSDINELSDLLFK